MTSSPKPQAPSLLNYTAIQLTRRLLLSIVWLSLVAPAGLVAHDKIKITGTIVKVQATQLDVKALDGATYEIDMNESTQVMRELKKVPQSELRHGLRVTVDALGHDMFDLEAVLVRIERSPPP